MSFGSPARNACATPVPGGRATTWPGRTGCSSSPSSSVPAPSSTTNSSSSAEWQVRRVGQLARLDDEVPDADSDRAEHVAQVETDAGDVAVAALGPLALGEA